MVFFWTKKKNRRNDLIPKGVVSTVIPSVFIDGNKNPIWDNNHKLLIKSKKQEFKVW